VIWNGTLFGIGFGLDWDLLLTNYTWWSTHGTFCPSCEPNSQDPVGVEYTEISDSLPASTTSTSLSFKRLLITFALFKTTFINNDNHRDRFPGLSLNLRSEI
jgi:hypothetical protein